MQRVNRRWSHAALHDPFWGTDTEHWPAVDGHRARPFLVGLLVTTADGDECHSIGRPTVAGWASWISGGDPWDTDAHREAENLITAVAALDWAWADAARFEDGGLTKAFRAQERQADRLRRSAQPELTAALRAGLERRLGQRVKPTELPGFLQMAARLASPQTQTYVSGLQVCDFCDLVFEPAKTTARRCPEHRKRNLPILHPVRTGGWHVGISGDPADGTLVYLVQCECGNTFSDHRESQRLCEGCRADADRVRRLRLRRAPSVKDASQRKA